MAFNWTLSSRATPGKFCQICLQYSMRGRIVPTYREKSCLGVKHFLSRNNTPSFWEADFARVDMCPFQVKSDLKVRPKMLSVSQVWRTSELKFRFGSNTCCLRENEVHWVFELLNFTKLFSPHLLIAWRSSFKPVTKELREFSKLLEFGAELKLLDICKVESSA